MSCFYLLQETVHKFRISPIVPPAPSTIHKKAAVSTFFHQSTSKLAVLFIRGCQALQYTTKGKLPSCDSLKYHSPHTAHTQEGYLWVHNRTELREERRNYRAQTSLGLDPLLRGQGCVRGDQNSSESTPVRFVSLTFAAHVYADLDSVNSQFRVNSQALSTEVSKPFTLFTLASLTSGKV